MKRPAKIAEAPHDAPHERSDASRRRAAKHRRKIKSDPTRYIFADRPRCPSCRSAELKANRSERDGDAIYRHVRCDECGEKFILVLK